jgi:hypothetical protein
MKIILKSTKAGYERLTALSLEKLSKELGVKVKIILPEKDEKNANASQN